MKTSLVIKELERMSPDELGRELRLKRAEAAGQRMDLEMGKGKNSAKYKALRKDIARMTMVLGSMGKNAKPAAKIADKTASKVEKNPVQDSGSAPKKATKAPAAKKKAA